MTTSSMNPDVGIQELEIATGLKELLEKCGHTTVRSIIESSVEDIAECLHIEPHVAKIIVDEARRIHFEGSAS